MDKILISWIATGNDFKREQSVPVKVNPEGTTVSFHKHFYETAYEKHILLSAKKEEDLLLTYLLNFLGKEFPEHLIEGRHLGVSDVISLEQIRSKIEPLLFEFKDYEIDIFISPGTPAMQTAWILAHMTLGLKTNLFQVRPKKYTASKSNPELLTVDITKDTTTASTIIRETNSRKTASKKRNDFLETESIKPIYIRAKKVAQAPNSTVLIIGDTGTGKEHLAHYIHQESPRRDASFTPINCAAMSDQLLESRLFGYKKGAFTGAEKDTKGIIELAEGGTVFLDEIGDISAYMQQVLLRLLQEKEITPIGGKTKKTDVRFVSATNRDLFKLCEEEKFRWDLYYRLSVVDLELPSLKERGQKELKELINFFLKQKRKLFNSSENLKIPSEIFDKILSYPFPGNIRELENLIERLYVISGGDPITLRDLPKRMLQSETSNSLLLKDTERQHIAKILRINNGVLRKTARDIGVSFNTLKNKIEKYGIVI